MWAGLHLAGSVLGAGLSWPVALTVESSTWPLQSVLTRLAGLAVAWLAWRRRPPCWVFAGLVLAAALAGGSWEAEGRRSRAAATAPRPMAPAQAENFSFPAILRVTSWPSSAGPDRWRAAAILIDGAEIPESGPGPRRGEGFLLTVKGQAPSPGRVLVGQLSSTVPARGGLPGAFDYREFLAGRHLRWLGRLDQPVEREAGRSWLPAAWLGSLRNRLLDDLATLLPGREAELAAAVLLGARSAGSRQGALPFADLGLAHLFAVSGLHVGILLGMVVLPGKAAGLSCTGRFWPLLVFVPVYALLTGLPGSVVRAGGLALLAGGAGALGRRPRPLHLLGVLFWLTTLWEPSQVLDPGTRLSYLAAGGILATVGLAAGYRGWAAPLVTALTVSVAAQWFTLPQAALSFGRFSLLAPLANLVAVPLFGMGVWAVTLAVATLAVWPWLAQSLAAVGWLLLRGLAGLVALVSGVHGGWNVGLAVPGPGLGLVWALLTVTVLALVGRARSGSGRPLPPLLAVLLLVVVGHGVFAWAGWRMLQADQPLVWQFDVGQGDCALVSFPDRWRCLIDTGGVFGFGSSAGDGPVARSVVPFLKRGWVENLPLVLLSHGHLDHTGGVPAVNGALTVERWLTGGDANLDIARWQPHGFVEPLTESRVLHRWRDWTLEAVVPHGGCPTGFHENDRSLLTVLRRQGQTCMAWSGDMEKEGEGLLLEQGLAPARAQVWKAGHHGSNTSGSSPWVAEVNPELIIVSCGVGNSYGHPNHGQYVTAGDTVPVLRTDLDGAVELRWDAAGALIWRSRNGRGQLPALP